jgi:hypothetical protein
VTSASSTASAIQLFFRAVKGPQKPVDVLRSLGAAVHPLLNAIDGLLPRDPLHEPLEIQA